MKAPAPLPPAVGAQDLSWARRFDAATFAATPGLEEVQVDGASGVVAGLCFLLSRLAGGEARLVVFAAPRHWFVERGRPYGQGLVSLGAGLKAQAGAGAARFLIVAARNEAETLWALEEVLRSGAAALAVGAVEGASLVASRRLDLAARGAGALVALVRTTPQRNLSAARRRWRVAPAPSAPHPWDAKASGAPRWRTVLERSRDGATGEALVEFDHETLRLRLVDGLADHGLALGRAGPARQNGASQAA